MEWYANIHAATHSASAFDYNLIFVQPLELRQR